MSEYLEPFFDPDTCPWVSRQRTDGRDPDLRRLADRKSRLKRLVINDELGRMVTTEIKPRDIEDWKRRLRENGTGARTVNLVISDLRTAIRESLHAQDGAFQFDPLSTVSRVREETTSRGALTKDQVKTLMDSANWDYNEDARLKKADREERTAKAHLFALLMFTTGERPKAIESLRWEDVDLDDGSVRYRDTKTRAARGRFVPLTTSAIDAFRRVQDLSVRINPVDYVFCNTGGERLLYQGWFRRKRWQRAATAAKIPEHDVEGNRITPYSLKYTVISLLLDDGADELLVRELVGHSHTYGSSRVLTPAQSRYKRRKAERLRDLLPMIEGYVT
jgi:integrase